MAPVQCATWGHPVTTGSPKMDVFISSELLEVPEADRHYSERLIRLPSLGTYYERARISEPRKTRADLGLPENRHLYLCPQTLYKFHPEFDAILDEILQRDREGEFILIEGRAPSWTQLLKERFARTMPAAARRIRWLAPLPNQDFLQLLAMGDVVIDPIHFGGGNTTYEALAMGTPVVTWPGQFLRSRITLALYTKMNYLDAVVDSAEAYAATTVRIACDKAYRAAMRGAILRESQRLFADPVEIRDLAESLRSLAQSAPQ
jgi:predicted O-linked N-acetylglucosamine transferase (SPINDLY family)